MMAPVVPGRGSHRRPPRPRCRGAVAYAGTRMRARRSVLRVFVGRLGIALFVSTAVMVGGILGVNYTIDAKLNNVSRVDVHTATGPRRAGTSS